jgi:hypothetical protein
VISRLQPHLQRRPHAGSRVGGVGFEEVVELDANLPGLRGSW